MEWIILAYEEPNQRETHLWPELPDCHSTIRFDQRNCLTYKVADSLSYSHSPSLSFSVSFLFLFPVCYFLWSLPAIPFLLNLSSVYISLHFRSFSPCTNLILCLSLTVVLLLSPLSLSISLLSHSPSLSPSLSLSLSVSPTFPSLCIQMGFIGITVYIQCTNKCYSKAVIMI